MASRRSESGTSGFLLLRGSENLKPSGTIRRINQMAFDEPLYQAQLLKENPRMLRERTYLPQYSWITTQISMAKKELTARYTIRLWAPFGLSRFACVDTRASSCELFDAPHILTEALMNAKFLSTAY